MQIWLQFLVCLAKVTATLYTSSRLWLPSQSDGDVICSRVTPAARRVFRLEAVLEASVEQLYDLLFVRVEEMNQWNPSIQDIKVSH